MATEGDAPDALLLWQPVASGKQWVSQFLRLATAQQITGMGGERRRRQGLAGRACRWKVDRDRGL